MVRFRSIGDVTCTGACESKADTIDDIIAEVASATTTEREQEETIRSPKQVWKIVSNKDISKMAKNNKQNQNKKPARNKEEC